MNELFPLPAGTAFFPATGKFVDGGPGAGLRSFRACALFLVAGLDVFRLAFLLAGVTGFIALRHGCANLLIGAGRRVCARSRRIDGWRRVCVPNRRTAGCGCIGDCTGCAARNAHARVGGLRVG